MLQSCCMVWPQQQADCFCCSPKKFLVVSLWRHVLVVQVNAEAVKIGKEADEANAIASECQAGLDKALPALQAAEDALNVLTKKDMSELKVSPGLACQCTPSFLLSAVLNILRLLDLPVTSSSY